MKFPPSIVVCLAAISACGPPDEKVRTAEDAARLAQERCHKDSLVNEWRAERNGDYWIARYGQPDSQGRSLFTARIKAADGNPVCEVTLSWSKS